MKFDGPYKILDTIDISELRDAVLSLEPSVWDSNTYRQTAYQVHYNTKSVVLIFTTGDGWPNIEITHEDGWEMLKEFVTPIMDDILAKHYPPGGTIIRSMIANLTAGNVISSHIDSHQSFRSGHRIHIPITTNKKVRFMIDGKINHFEVGKVYELNNQLMHSVMNRGKEDRYTLIFDYVPPIEECIPTYID